jgi:hypothetical protein
LEQKEVTAQRKRASGAHTVTFSFRLDMRDGTRSRALLRRRRDVLTETGIVATETGPKSGCIFVSATSTPLSG